MANTVRDWRIALIEAHANLFHPPVGHPEAASGYPSCGDGWRELVETAVGRIADAIAAAPAGTLRIVTVKEKFAGLRLYWQSSGLSAEIQNAVREAVALAEARSICTCETCGEPGLLFKRGGRMLTACEEHAQGDAVAIRPGRENLHIIRRLEAGLPVVSCRRYIRETDSFIDVDPQSLGIEE
jgi:hypothetical protein